MANTASHGTSHEKPNASEQHQKPSGGIQGGTHEQHVKAGEQSHKNAGASSASTGASTGTSHNSTQGGTHEQHVKAGQQSHKNS